uniref:SAP domain-containing protein n=1 Tax=Sinocyclocheilus rhinocerous TaxID=307959 RepID=A0A673G652_9TELE
MREQEVPIAFKILHPLQVAELKMELKLRGLPVSGTKTDLIERLKAHQESVRK